MSMTKTTLPVNIGGEPPKGEGGILGEAVVTITSGGVYFQINLAGVASFPVVSFDRTQLQVALAHATFSSEVFPASEG